MENGARRLYRRGGRAVEQLAVSTRTGRVSVIVPADNLEEYLAGCLDSLTVAPKAARLPVSLSPASIDPATPERRPSCG